MPLPALSACRGAPRTHAEPKLREGHPRTHGGIGAGIPCRRRAGRRATPAVRAHAVPREQSPIPRRIGGRANPGAHASEPGAAPGPPPGAPHPSPGQTPALRSAPPAAGPTPGGERHCSGGAGGQQAGGRCRAITSRCASEQVALPRRTRPPPHPARTAGCVPALGSSEGEEPSVSERGGERHLPRAAAARSGALGGGGAGRLRAERAGLGLGPRPAPPLRPPGCESARLRITWRLPEAETREERKKKRLIPSSTAILYFIVTLIFIPPFYSRSWKVFLENEVRFGFLVNGR
ncbi:RNA-binding Raly-like protein isoform X3 [Zonotrichia albicollis]|uniref:RNA-binding Raly-like protein isoform X3 n=1 Tax=Zonotrichia albicollis TaxID=44394 RepID=UPI003D80EA25